MRAGLFAVWLMTAAAGLVFMLNYQNAAGGMGKVPAHWPSESAIPLAPDRPTLVLFAHPKCPCTRATMGELNRLLAKLTQRVAARVVFFRPADAAPDWSQTDLWRSAQAIPGVAVQEDVAGRMARRFGAETSGSVFLYDQKGRLIFKGGITAGRGHSGDNAGSEAIIALLDGRNAALKQTPVYGCSILNSCDTASNGKAICKP